jgi:hypothetical protein
LDLFTVNAGTSCYTNDTGEWDEIVLFTIHGPEYGNECRDYATSHFAWYDENDRGAMIILNQERGYGPECPSEDMSEGIGFGPNDIHEAEACARAIYNFANEELHLSCGDFPNFEPLKQ